MSMKNWSPNRRLEQDDGVLAGEGDGVDPASQGRAFFSTPVPFKGSSLNPLCLDKRVLWSLQLFHF